MVWAWGEVWAWEVWAWEEEWEEEWEEGEEDVVLVVCGSFFVVSAARAYLARHRPEMLRETDWAFEADPPFYT